MAGCGAADRHQRGVEPSRVRCMLTVTGLVQGVGFRPYVYALARELGLSGSVGNAADGVIVEVEGLRRLWRSSIVGSGRRPPFLPTSRQ